MSWLNRYVYENLIKSNITNFFLNCQGGSCKVECDGCDTTKNFDLLAAEMIAKSRGNATSFVQKSEKMKQSIGGSFSFNPSLSLGVSGSGSSTSSVSGSTGVQTSASVDASGVTNTIKEGVQSIQNVQASTQNVQTGVSTGVSGSVQGASVQGAASVPSVQGAVSVPSVQGGAVGGQTFNLGSITLPSFNLGGGSSVSAQAPSVNGGSSLTGGISGQAPNANIQGGSGLNGGIAGQAPNVNIQGGSGLTGGISGQTPKVNGNASSNLGGSASGNGGASASAGFSMNVLSAGLNILN